MKAVITVKVNGGMLHFPYDGPITLNDIESSEVTKTSGYGYLEEAGKAIYKLISDHKKEDGE